MQADLVLLNGKNKKRDAIAGHCRNNSNGIINTKRKNKTGFSWMYLEDYEKIYGKF